MLDTAVHTHTHTHHAQHITTDHSAGICCMYGCTVLNEPMGSPFPCSVSYFCMCVSVCLFIGCFINSLRGKITAEIPLWLNVLFLDVTWNIVWSPSLSLSLSLTDRWHRQKKSLFHSIILKSTEGGEGPCRIYCLYHSKPPGRHVERETWVVYKKMKDTAMTEKGKMRTGKMLKHVLVIKYHHLVVTVFLQMYWDPVGINCCTPHGAHLWIKLAQLLLLGESTGPVSIHWPPISQIMFIWRSQHF